MPNFASQSRVAFASIVSNTGSSSPGEAADDLEHVGGRGLLLQRFGQVVGALAHSLSSRAFSMAITAWSAKFLTQVDLFVGERPHFVR